MNKTQLYLIPISILLSCTPTKQATTDITTTKNLQTEIDSLKTVITENMSETKNQITTFLTFQNQDAEEAMNMYVELFDNSEVIEVQRYGKDIPAPEGSIMFARFILNGKEVRCSDSPIKHEWDFSPGVSMFVECTSVAEQERLFEKLSANGKIMMPLNNYGFSQKFGWVEDKFGISWQLNLQ